MVAHFVGKGSGIRWLDFAWSSLCVRAPAWIVFIRRKKVTNGALKDAKLDALWDKPWVVLDVWQREITLFTRTSIDTTNQVLNWIQLLPTKNSNWKEPFKSSNVERMVGSSTCFYTYNSGSLNLSVIFFEQIKLITVGEAKFTLEAKLITHGMMADSAIKMRSQAHNA